MRRKPQFAALGCLVLWISASIAGGVAATSASAEPSLAPLVPVASNRTPSFVGVSRWNVLAHVEQRVEATAEASIEEILTNADQETWSPVSNHEVGGFHSRDFWLRVRFEFPANPERDWVVHFAGPQAESVDAYWVRDGVVQESEFLGTVVPVADRDMPTMMPAFAVPDHAGTQDLYLHVQSRLPTYTAINLYRRIDAFQHESRHSLIPLVSCGVILGLAIYNLFLFLSTRQSMDALEERPSLLRIEAEAKGEEAQICVIDNGGWIAADDLPKIFQHGFTTRSEGSGFGLHSAANAAGLLGGRLYVDESRSEPGACFVLELPARPNSDVAPVFD